MKQLLIIVVVLAMAVGTLAGCELMGFKDWEWRQKLTVEVAGPSGPISGSSVIAVRCGTSPTWLGGISGAGGLGCQVRGEAVSVEMGQGKFLFALLIGEGSRHSYLSELALTLFHTDVAHLSTDEKLDRLATLRTTATIPRDSQNLVYPQLVTFTDITAPKTVQEVDPENLAATFGSGVSLKRITLEITDEAVTEGKVERVLGWLNDLKKYRTDPSNPFTNTLPKEIGYLRRKAN